MEEMRDKMKGLMKKVNFSSSSSSSSGKFKGQGRVLGSSSSSSPPLRNSDPSPHKTVASRPTESGYKKPEIQVRPNPNSETGFDPFNSLITSGKRNPNGYSLQVFECPVCGRGYSSEEEVSTHIESCVKTSESVIESNSTEEEEKSEVSRDQLGDCITTYVSAKPSDAAIEIVMKLLGNIVKEPGNSKFRKIRLVNPKIKEAIADIPGGVELLEHIGFVLKEEDGEMFLVMEDEPTEDVIGLAVKAISLLEKKKEPPVESQPLQKLEKPEPIQPKQVDRQVRVFFSVPESVAARIEVPDSFYNLTAEDLKREAEMRRRKLEESKLLIPKSYREKQAQASKRRYKKTLIRVQFPDGVVLQAIFSPSEPTVALYEFVSSALKDPSLEFELLHPVVVKRRVIPHSTGASEKRVTLEDEDLVPSALIKFKPIETDDIVFTGLSNELLLISEPLQPGP